MSYQPPLSRVSTVIRADAGPFRTSLVGAVGVGDLDDHRPAALAVTRIFPTRSVSRAGTMWSSSGVTCSAVDGGSGEMPEEAVGVREG